MTTPDPADLRLLAMLAEDGKGAVHELAARLGMDAREAAVRLINLSAGGLPLVVGAECDQGRLRGHLAALQTQYRQSQAYQPPQQPHAQPNRQPAGHQPGQYPAAPHQPGQNQAAPYPPAPNQAGRPTPAPDAQPAPGATPGPQAGPPGTHPPYPAGPPAPQPTAGGDPALGMWGPPQSSAWARGDAGSTRTGRVGDELHTTGLDGDPISIRLVELVDPADFLYTAAGYTLGETERTVVVHTELTNHGSRTYQTLPDQYLVLHTADGHAISKAPISLSSRPPHTMGVPAGETAGGHAVYVINERTRILEVRWLARPDSQDKSLTWEL